MAGDRDRLRLLAGLGREGVHLRVVEQQVIEVRDEEPGLARRGPERVRPEPGQGQEAPETLRIGREKAERADRDPLGAIPIHPGSLRLHVAVLTIEQGSLGTLRDRREGVHAAHERVGRRVGPMAKTVLIVEDNELNMKLFNDLLEANGYRTLQTRDGHAVMEIARREKPDLILMDIQLPEVSGLEVTKWLKDDDELKAIPVVAVTAFAMKGDEERIRAGGCEAYLSKPISVAKFVGTIRGFLGDPRS